MPDAAADCSKTQLIAYAAERGRVVSPAQFDRWRKSGLLPSPVLKGLGQGLGTQAHYPPVGPQLIAVVDQLRKSRSVDDALWRLWWDGHPIDASRIRSLLDAALLNAEEASLGLQQLYDSDEHAERFETSVLTRSTDHEI